MLAFMKVGVCLPNLAHDTTDFKNTHFHKSYMLGFVGRNFVNEEFFRDLEITDVYCS